MRPGNSRNYFSLIGHTTLAFHKWEISDAETFAQAKTLLLQEMLRLGVLVLGTHKVTTAYTEANIEFVAQAFRESLSRVADALDAYKVLSLLECEPIHPLFKARS